MFIFTLLTQQLSINAYTSIIVRLVSVCLHRTGIPVSLHTIARFRVLPFFLTPSMPSSAECVPAAFTRLLLRLIMVKNRNEKGVRTVSHVSPVPNPVSGSLTIRGTATLPHTSPAR